MAKPIFIVKLPYNKGDVKLEQIQRIQSGLDDKITDYHVLVVLDVATEKIEFELFNSPHTEVEFEDLKKIVLEKIDSL